MSLLLFLLELLVETASGDVVEQEQLLPALWKLERRLASEARVKTFRQETDEEAEADLSLRRSNLSSHSEHSDADSNDDRTAGLLLRARYEPDITHPIYSLADLALPDTLRVVLSLTHSALRHLNRFRSIFNILPFRHTQVNQLYQWIRLPFWSQTQVPRPLMVLRLKASPARDVTLTSNCVCCFLPNV